MKKRDFLIGKEYLESRNQYKYAMLRAQLSLLTGFILLAYIIIDYINGVTMFIPWYLGGIFMSWVVFYLNRTRRFTASSVVLLIVTNALVYFFSAVDNPSSGVFFFYAATAITGLALFNYINLRLGILFVCISIFLAMLAFINDWSPIPAPEQSELALRINFIINLLLGLFSSVVIVFFILKRNKESEEALVTLTKELQKSKDRFSMALDGSRAGIYEWDIATNKVFVSTRWLELLGYSREDNMDITLDFFMSLVHPEDAQRTSEKVENALKNGAFYQNELRMKQKDGKYKWFLDCGLVKNENGQAQVAVGSIMDIDDRVLADLELKNKNNELKKTNAELDSFVYIASHDMRAPLSTLLGLIELARRSQDAEELSKYFDLMSNRIYTMEGFIKEVTDYSRNTRLELAHDKVRLKSVAQEVLKSFEFLANEAKVNLELDIADESEVFTDVPRLKVILNNLVANAIKYHNPLRKSRFVRVSISVEDVKCIIRIEDNGVGIKPEYQEKIYDMFFRASEKSDGSGLGLYIVKETLQRLDGTIACKSDSNGSTFIVNIPINSKIVNDQAIIAD